MRELSPTHRARARDAVCGDARNGSVDVDLTVGHGVALHGALVSVQTQNATYPYGGPCERQPIRQSLRLLNQHGILLVCQLVCAHQTAEITDRALEDTVYYEPLVANAEAKADTNMAVSPEWS